MSQKSLSPKSQLAQSQPARKPAKFTARSKLLASAAALTALIGGWDWIGHLEVSKASAAALQNSTSAEMKAAAATPTLQPTLQATALPTIAPLAIAPVPTLPAPSGLLSQEAMAKLTAKGPAFNLNVQAVAAPVALPALAPLPSLPPIPSLPALPTNNNSGGNNGGGNNGGGSGSQKSGGS